MKTSAIAADCAAVWYTLLLKPLGATLGTAGDAVVQGCAQTLSRRDDDPLTRLFKLALTREQNVS